MAESSEVRKRTRYEPPAGDWNPDLPYGGKVYLARKKKPDSWWVTSIEIGTLVFVFCFAYYAYYYFDHLHFHVTHGYAHMGFKSAQHQVGMKFLHGSGVEKDHPKAMEWFKKAADQGHPHASYNLAIGHLRGIKTGLEKGAAHRLISHAAANGVKEAAHALDNICSQGGCND